ncbi:hypothetical protein J4456_05075 [Candidatus Pacearchaeota archaeon]|nr:hypothetical protein [Candidatus Pacearchaeota archaeon]
MPFKDPGKRREYRRRWYDNNKKTEKAYIEKRKKRIRHWFAQFKSTLQCSNCKENHPATLDFHHTVNYFKESGINIMVYNGYSINKIKSELEKCIVLCSNCHRKWHHENKKPYKSII